jgi:hypothetical protein
VTGNSRAAAAAACTVVLWASAFVAIRSADLLERLGSDEAPAAWARAAKAACNAALLRELHRRGQGDAGAGT